MKVFESVWLIKLQWFMNKQYILSNVQASLATRLWLLLNFVNSAALIGTVLGKRMKLLKECRIRLLLYSFERAPCDTCCFLEAQISLPSDFV